jgi:hypothetical protein
MREVGLVGRRPWRAAGKDGARVCALEWD